MAPLATYWRLLTYYSTIDGKVATICQKPERDFHLGTMDSIVEYYVSSRQYVASGATIVRQLPGVHE